MTVIHPTEADPFAPLLAVPPERLADDPHGPQLLLSTPAPAALAAGVWCPLPDYGLLAASGADRLVFLQGQLTNDVQALADGTARWNGYCSPKGRLLQVLLTWQETESVMLTVSRAQAETLRKRLSMFVLRSKVSIVDRSADRPGFGLLAAEAAPLLARLGADTRLPPMAVARSAGFTVVRLPDVDTAQAGRLCRLMVWADLADTAPLAEAFGGLLAAPTAVWRWAEIRSAVPRVFPATAEHFVPQMVNLELVGGVSFTKGCYPGQEVVARSQYLGKLKRRMFIGHGPVALAPATEVLSADAGQAVGEVVMSAPAPDGGHDTLFECQTEAAEGGLSAGGAPLRIVPLPYPIPLASPVRRSL